MWKRHDLQTLFPTDAIGRCSGDPAITSPTTMTTTAPINLDWTLHPAASAKSMSVETSPQFISTPTPKPRLGNVLKALPDLPQT